MKPVRPTVRAPALVAAALVVVLGACADAGAPTAQEEQGTAPSATGTDPVTDTGRATDTGSPTGTAQETDTAQTTAPDPATEDVAEVTPPVPACLAAARALDREDQVGQLFMLGLDARAPVGTAYRDLLARTRPGSVLLLGESHAGVEATAALTAAVREAAPTPGGVGLLVAVDQEGGQVQRLQGPGFDRIPSAVEQARMDVDDLRAAATRWGEQLRAAGVDVTLAPVADVVPPEWAGTNEPAALLARHYGADAEEVQPAVAAFVEGMDEAGVGTSLKHFPGLGRVAGNTDFSGGVVDDETGPDHPDLQAFAGRAGELADMVMVSTAVYDRIDPGVPAAFSPVVIDNLLRGELGFDGVVIADDLGAAAQVSDVPPGERAVRFLRAGGDVVINADPAVHGQMVDAVDAAVAADPGFADEIEAKVARVLAMKERRGVAGCG